MPTRVAAQELLRVLYGTRYVAPLGRRYGNAILEIIKGMCPKIPLCVICVHSYTNILQTLHSYTTPSKFDEKSRHLCILDEGIIRHLPRKCFTYGDTTLGC